MPATSTSTSIALRPLPEVFPLCLTLPAPPSCMNVEDFRNYCLSLPGVTEKMPFTTLKDPYGRDVLCFYIGSKWFCYVNIEVFDRCCVKTSAADAEELRERYAGIRPAWHMNKRLWSDVYFGSDVPDSLIRDLVRRSYGIVKASLPLKERDRLATP